jgi:hypothetical protein
VSLAGNANFFGPRTICLTQQDVSTEVALCAAKQKYSVGGVWYEADVNCTYKGFALGVTETNDGAAVREASLGGAAIAALYYDDVRIVNFTAATALAVGETITHFVHGRYGENDRGEVQTSWGTYTAGPHAVRLVSDPDGAAPTEVATATLRYCGVEGLACDCGSKAAVSALTVGPVATSQTWAWGTASGANLVLTPADTVVKDAGVGRVVPLRFTVSETLAYAGANAAAADITRLGPTFVSVLEVAPVPGGFGTTPNWTAAVTLMTRDVDPVAPGVSTNLSVDVPLAQLPTDLGVYAVRLRVDTGNKLTKESTYGVSGRLEFTAWYAPEWPADLVLRSAKVLGAAIGGSALELTAGGTACVTPGHLANHSTRELVVEVEVANEGLSATVGLYKLNSVYP